MLSSLRFLAISCKIVLTRFYLISQEIFAKIQRVAFDPMTSVKRSHEIWSMFPQRYSENSQDLFQDYMKSDKGERWLIFFW